MRRAKWRRAVAKPLPLRRGTGRANCARLRRNKLRPPRLRLILKPRLACSRRFRIPPRRALAPSPLHVAVAPPLPLHAHAHAHARLRHWSTDRDAFLTGRWRRLGFGGSAFGVAMADAGYGLGVKEDAKTVEVGAVKRQGPKVVTGVGGEEKNGSDVSVEGTGGEEQVAKKARVEKVENGGEEKGEEVGHGVESVEGVVEKDGGEGEGNNGAAEGEGEGEEGDQDGVGGEEGDDEGEEEGVTGKDAAPGDVGLRTLLQEGDDTKTSVANHGADATHMLNGAK